MASVDMQDRVERFDTFYRDYYEDQIAELAQRYPAESRSLFIDWTDLYRFDEDLAEDVLSHPDRLVREAEEALRLFDLPVDVSLGQAHVRFHGLPETTAIRDIRASHVNRLVSVRGIIRKSTGVKPRIEQAAFECQRCGTMSRIPQEGGKFQEPHQCQGCERKGPFRIDEAESDFVDAQKLRIQESPEGLRGGETPESIDITIEDDITGDVSAGDSVRATGILRLQQQGSEQEKSTLFNVTMEGTSIVAEEEQFDEMDITEADEAKIVEMSNDPDIYQQMVDSIAPSIYGHEGAKFAMVLQLFSGVTKHLPDGSRTRGDMHLLFIGDPGTGKSKLLQYTRHIAPRSVYTSGKGSSSAGLTAAAVRDDFGDGQQWSLEAGALVLADRGIAAIDELDKMAPDDRSALHEGLEAQEISISKAGINATLKARCSLLGAANPTYGRFDMYEPMGEQIDLEPALISRFDLIFTITDQPNEEEDRRLADHILETNYAGQLHRRRSELRAPDVTEEEVQAASSTVTPPIEPELFRKYVAFAQQSCYPRLTPEARQAIEDFYVDLRSRGVDDDAPVPITARKLEALVRLSEASARVRLSDTVELEDAERVIEIVRSCLQDIGVDPETGQYDADVIETGRSKTQRDRVKSIKDIIRSLQDQHEEGAPREDVLAEAESAGIDRDKAEHQIKKLRDQGEVYSPSGEHLRVV